MVMKNGFSRVKFYSPILINEISNFIKYGGKYKSHQKIYINPSNVNKSTRFFELGETKYLLDGSDLNDENFINKRHKFIVGGEWDKLTTRIENLGPYFRYMKRLSDKKSWEDVGEIEWLMKRIKQLGVQDSCRTLEDIYNRLQKIDQICNTVKRMGRLKEMKEIRKFVFREKGGVGIGIGREGELIWIGDGAHRLAMAKFFGFIKIPATLLIVHKDFVKSSS